MVHMKKQPRKTRRQLQAEKLSEAKKLINKANSLEAPLPNLYQNFTSKDEINFDISCSRAKDLPPETCSWIMDLMERNMKKSYESSSWGWSADKKRQELFDSTAWQLVASTNSVYVGFSHFRFDVDDDREVLYCYELQLESCARRKGLGRFMMQALESMALQNKMQKVVLTVFKSNTSAVAFFHSLGYKLDITSPNDEHYVILSKLCRD